MRETATSYGRPYRPLPIALANGVGELLRRAGVGRPRFDADRVIAAARRAERLDDLGGDDFREPMNVLLRSLESEAALTPVGAAIAGQRLVGSVRNRLRVVAARSRLTTPARHSAPPLLITGLQRTGTTFLQRLLGSEPRLRPLRSWEALAAVPHRGKDGHGPDTRMAAAKQAEQGLRFLAPDFFAIHPVDADGPEEEVLLMDPCFRSPVPEATFRVPSYSRWLEAADQRPAYAWLRDSLDLIAATDAHPRPWLLKSPAHLEHLDVLIDTFPGIRVVHTHRDPVETVASFCSMIAHGRGIFSDAVNPAEVGREWLRKTARMVDRAFAVRDARGDAAFLDVRYDDLVSDPLSTVSRIYAFAGLEFDDAARSRVEAMLRRSPRHRFGRHRYRLEDFGLGAADVEASFAAYRRRFGMG